MPDIRSSRIFERLAHRRVRLALIIAAYAVVGVYLLAISRAADNAALAGDLNNDNVVNLSDLSILISHWGETSTTTPPPATPPATPPGPLTGAAPTKVKVFVGGNDIAVTWIPASDAAGNIIGTYNVYRNNVKVATTLPDSDNGSAAFGAQYIDKNVSGSQTYSYQIETVIDGAAVSPKTTAVSATQPTSSAPVPNVVLDSSIDTYAASQKAWLTKYAVPALTTWYPKVAQKLAYPDYTPLTTIRLAALDDATFTSRFGDTSVGWSNSDDTIFLRPSSINKKTNGFSDSIGKLVNVSALQTMNLPGDLKMPRWLYNGISAYAEYGIYNDTPWVDALADPPQDGDYYTDGRLTAAKFLNWVQGKYDANYMRKVTVAAHTDTFSATFMTFSDGRNYDEAWSLWRNAPDITDPLINLGTNKCLDNAGSVLASNNRIQLWGCNGSSAQKFTLQYIAGTDYNLLVVQGYCLQAMNSIENSTVRLVQCDKANVSQQWKIRETHFLANANSDRCMVPYLGGATDGTEVVIANCNGTASQVWYQPAP